ncbi:restriction endonuclease subunit S [Acinetobacter sp. YH12131]|uniref:restriction endonuclease subunit S n=1 Tax=Acinetobacter sp. YH12131 TaxID=2601115 RepID=UPI0015D37517|nr:restriction endonuclease subunit S [Acinetobacter sp. YH12131]
MDFKQYPSYKDSGVEWLGEVPEHWQQKPIWSLFSRIKRVNHPNEPLLSVYRDYGVILKDSRDDNHNRASEDLTPYQLVRPNDLVINKMKAWQGSIAISEYQGIVSPAYYVYEPKQPYCSKYIHFLIRSTYFIQSYKNFSKGIRVNQWDLEHDAFTHIDLLLPPLSEQNKIVSFLDTETSRIDHLIAKQEKLIEKLEEHRKSVISHAVTKGLDPNVPMKDSGVEWLGEVPEHWVGSKFKYIFQEKQHTKNMNLPFGAISFGSVVYKKDKANLTDELKENYQEVLQGEFLVNPLNLNYDLKSLRTALSKIDVVVSSGYFVLKLKNNTFNKRYLEYLLYIFDIRKMKTLGAGIRQTLTFKDMAVCDVAIPSACEQTQIASFLDYENFRIDNLIAKQEKLIEKLKEYRTSIISHAVTGKIDVRDLVA